MNPIRRYRENGQLEYEEWWLDGKCHRVDGPAKQHWYENGQLMQGIWYVNDKRHRLDGPAFQGYYENGQLWLETWAIDGKLHRVDGPAIRRWNLEGQLDIEEWRIEEKKVKPIEDPLAWALFIAKTFGNVHGLEKFCLDNMEERRAKALLASARFI